MIFLVDLAFGDSESTAIEAIQLSCGAVVFVSIAWGVKEFIRPSKWRKVPEWMHEQGLMERPKAD